MHEKRRIHLQLNGIYDRNTIRLLKYDAKKHLYTWIEYNVLHSKLKIIINTIEFCIIFVSLRVGFRLFSGTFRAYHKQWKHPNITEVKKQQ